MRLFLPSVAVAQVTASSPPGVAEVERVVVTGSNIPTAEEIGPNPVDTYRPADTEKLGIRNATDLQTFLPQEAGSTLNLNMGNGIWPAQRPDPKPSLDAVMSQAQLEKKVEDYLRDSQALEDYWQRGIPRVHRAWPGVLVGSKYFLDKRLEARIAAN